MARALLRAVPTFVSALVLSQLLQAQRNTGELRLFITDAAGLALEANGEIASQTLQLRRLFTTDSQGRYTARGLPYGLYRLRVERQGFAPITQLIEIRSEVPLERRISLGVAPIETVIEVYESAGLIDPHRTGAASYIDAEAIQQRRGSLPGRSVPDLVQTQPGWLLEANGVLHPRGAEYNTQYLIDGFPIVDNRSPAFAAGLDADNAKSMNILTGNYPAEYGRKLGGVIEIETARDTQPGLHGHAVAEGGSFSTTNGYLEIGAVRGRTAAGASVQGFHTGRYLDPPVEENFTNRASGGGFGAYLERDWTPRDRLRLSVAHSRTGLLVPDERLQWDAGQRQDRRNGETMGQASYQRILSPSLLASLRAMLRDVSAQLWSNPLSTPMLAGQDRGFREAYLSAAISGHRGRHEWKAGAKTVLTSVRESFSYRIINDDFFDDDVPGLFRVDDRRQGREQAVFAQDLVRAGRWTFSVGLRWDHYRLLVDENAWSPRLGVSYYWPGAGLLLRASYDRAFEIPAIENLLLASSPAAQHLTRETTGLPVRPSRGNFFETGIAKSVAGKLRLEAGVYRRNVRNFSDDDLLLNTGVSFPIAFSSARIQGFEVKLEAPRWGRFNGFVSWSNLSGVGSLPISGGLFLENGAELLRSRRRFAITQDQRNTANARLRGEISSRWWAAMGAGYGSGLPVEVEDPQNLQQIYGDRVVSRVNFARGRVRPSFSLDASTGVDLWRKEKRTAQLQASVVNLTGRLNVINFASLFSGTAIGMPRSVSLRFSTHF